MSATLPTYESEKSVSDKFVRHFGWLLFKLFGFFFVVTTLFLYLLIVGDVFRELRFWVAGLLWAPSCLISSIGFIQALSGVPCNRIQIIWYSLSLKRRVLIISFIAGLILVVFPFVYLLISLPPPAPVNLGDL